MFSRLITLIIKELLTILYDRQSRAIIIMPVILQAALFPFAATLDVTNASVGIYNEDSGQASSELVQRIAKTQAFSRVRMLHAPGEVRTAIDNQDVMLVVRFPDDFSRGVESGAGSELQMILDGRRSNSAQITYNYINEVVSNYQAQLAGGPGTGGAIEIRNWYNPNLNYKWFVVPSLVALITTIGVLVVTALSVAREREQGTFEQLLVSPLSTIEIFIGKAVPALIVATGQGTIILLAGIFLYRIPFSGSLLLYYLTIIGYGLSLVGFGLVISALCSTQQQAFIGAFFFLLPAILLSGYYSPVENMPKFLQYVSLINPVQHFIKITKQLYLKGAGFYVIWSGVRALLLITVTTGSAAFLLFRRKLA